MLYQICNGSLSFGDKVILSHVDMEIKGKEKIGIVGPNGTGKTTLLKVLSGDLSLDRDDKRQGKGILRSRQLRIGKLEQDHSQWQEMTMEEILLSGFYEKEGVRPNPEEKILNAPLDYSEERFFYQQRYEKMLNDFGFSVKEKEKKLREFSGGEQTKLMLVRLLLTEADLLLLDEPTNHLDEQSVEALEEYLKKYAGAVVVVSHDRYFLDQVAEVIYELEDAVLVKYDGNYSAYRKEKRQRFERQKKAYERQQEEIARNEQLIKQFKNKPRKAAFARSRKTILNRMERIEKPREDMGHIFTGELRPEYTGPKWPLVMEELKIGFEKQTPLLEALDLRVRRGQKIGILGKNGIGKSTLLKTLTEQVQPLKGKYLFGERIEVGYFDQSTGQMESEEKVTEYFRKLFPGMLEKDLYGKLASFLFKGSICQQKINTLSGGEKARLKLCELLTLCPNFLILDEPTNHMDIPAKETLESAFQAYGGTMLVVSHDRYFLDQVADALLVLEDGKAFYYPFGYSHYAQSKKRMERLLEKGVSLEEIPAMCSTQDQALVEELRAVPKADYSGRRRLSDEELYIDWKMGLAGEPLEDAEKAAFEQYETYKKIQQKYLERFLEEVCVPQMSEGLIKLQEERNQLRLDLESAVSAWTEACLNWFDIWDDTVGQKDI